nr:NAD(P)/FAD-dependent oxidoreductase [Bacillus swezeyi]
MNHFDVIVIGGGPSGLMAAIAAGEQGADVLLIDKGNKLGRKLAISGGGRCNVTNRLPIDEIIRHIPGNGRFLYSAFSEFNNEDIIKFFERLGVKLKEEDHGRMFPVSDKAQSVVDALLNRLEQLHVRIRANEKVKTVLYEDQKACGIITNNDEKILAGAVVVAVGGKSVPHTGSTGDGYEWAEKAGHKITELFPTEVPVTSSEPFIKQKTLQGLSLRNVALSVLNKKGKPVITHQMDMIFTHFGLSGPAVLRCSQFVVKELKKQESVRLKIDLFPDLHEEQLFQQMQKELKDAPKNRSKMYSKPGCRKGICCFFLNAIRLILLKPFLPFLKSVSDLS